MLRFPNDSCILVFYWFNTFLHLTSVFVHWSSALSLLLPILFCEFLSQLQIPHCPEWEMLCRLRCVLPNSIKKKTLTVWYFLSSCYTQLRVKTPFNIYPILTEAALKSATSNTPTALNIDDIHTACKHHERCLSKTQKDEQLACGNVLVSSDKSQ